jgi:hypothetical protein
MPDAAQATLALAKDYEATFTTEPGLRVLADLHGQAFMERPLFELNGAAPVDALRLLANEGRRSLVLYIRTRIAQARPDKTPQKTALTGSKDGTDG